MEIINLKKEKMKIVLVQPYLTSFSIGKNFYNIQSFGLSKELVKNGHQVIIVTSNFSKKRDDIRFNFLKRYEETINGFKVIYLPTLSDKFNQPILPTLIYELIKIKPDIVQAAEDFQISTLLTVIWSIFSKKPIVVYQGMYRYVSSLPWLHKLYLNTLGMVIYKFSKGFIAKTNSAKEFLISHKVSTQKIKVIPVGINRNQYVENKTAFLRELIGITEGKILLNIGRMVPEKDQKTLILALEIVRKKFPNVYLVIIGDGPEKNNLIKIINEKNLKDFVFLISEKIPNYKMNEVYSDCFLNLIPATYEIFNLTMLESISCGLPVIACNRGGMADVIKPGVNGYLFEEGDYKKCAEYIVELLENPDKYKMLSLNAKRTSQNYDWGNLADKFIEFYKSHKFR